MAPRTPNAAAKKNGDKPVPIRNARRRSVPSCCRSGENRTAQVLSQVETECGLVAITKNILLARSKTGSWRIFETAHSIAFQDLNHARTQFYATLSHATQFLAAAELVGDSAAIEEELRNFKLLHLPPSLLPRNVEALEIAARIRIVANMAMQSTMAVASPSNDRKRIEILKTLDRQARELLQAVSLG